MLLLACILTLLGAAQGDLPTAVEGKVLDSATRLPVPGAHVILARTEKSGTLADPGLYDTKPSAGDPDPAADRLAVLTGNDGVFRFAIQAPARFALFVDAPGYVRTQAGMTSYQLKPGVPIADISIRLTHELSISGRVVDDETGKPVPGLAVLAYRYRSSGRPGVPNGGMANTDENGSFVLDRMDPGDYWLEVRYPLRARIGKPKPVEDFRHAGQKTYASTWYPGVARAEESAPVRVVEGVVIEGLELKVARRRTAAIRGRVLGDISGEASLMLTSIGRRANARAFMVAATGKVGVGDEFEIEHLAPGLYSLMADLPGRTPAQRRWATMTFDVDEENQDGLDLHLRPAIPIRGHVRIRDREVRPDNPVLPFEDMRVGLQHLTGWGIMGESGPALVNSKDGSFAFDYVIADSYRISLTNPQGYAVHEVRYNKALQPHGVFTIDSQTDTQELDITLAPANASVLATATDGSRPTAGATVLLVPDPVEEDAIELGTGLRKAQADGDGHATIDGLLPGKYRLTAYPQGELWGDDPNLKARVHAGTEVRVSPNQTALIEVRTAPIR